MRSAALIAALCLAASPVSAQTLLTYSNTNTEGLNRYDASGESWMVQYDVSALAESAWYGAISAKQTLTIDMPDGARKTFNYDDSDINYIKSKYGAIDDTFEMHWSGKADNNPDEMVSLTVYKGNLFGAIFTEGGRYEFGLSENGDQLMMAVEAVEEADDMEDVFNRNGSKSETLPSIPWVPDETRSSAQAEVIDVGAAYTTTARDAAGGTDGVNGVIMSGVNLSNMAFANSAITPRFRLVGTVELSLGLSEFIEFQEPGDPAIKNFLSICKQNEEFNDFRNDVGADLIGLVKAFPQGSLFGKADLPTKLENDGFNSESKYCMWTALNAIQSRLTYTHEHGHNLGLNHDTTGAIDFEIPDIWIRQGARAYVDTANGFATVMARGSVCQVGGACTRVLHFSNPDVLYNGHVTGIEGERDNAGVAEEVASIVAAYRSSETPGPSPDAFEEDDTPGEWKAYAGTPQSRNFADDTVDWIASYNSASSLRTYETSGLESQADTCISVYHVTTQSLPGNLVGGDCDSGAGQGSHLVLEQQAGNYLIKVTNSNGFTGENTGYVFSVTNQQLTATPDAFEEDDTSADWKAYMGTPQTRNFADDTVDWVASYNGASRQRIYRTSGLGSNADTCITVYSVDAAGAPATQLARNCDLGAGPQSYISISQPEGSYLIKIENENGTVGVGTDYTFEIVNQ